MHSLKIKYASYLSVLITVTSTPLRVWMHRCHAFDNIPQLYVFYIHHPGADPGFLHREYNFTKGYRFVHFTCLFIYFWENCQWKWNYHENEIILSQRGVRASPLWICLCHHRKNGIDKFGIVLLFDLYLSWYWQGSYAHIVCFCVFHVLPLIQGNLISELFVPPTI